MKAFLVHAVDDGLHGDVAGQVPVVLRPLSPGIQVAEQAVEHHVQIGAVHIDPPPPVQSHQVLRPVKDPVAVGAHPGAAGVRLKGQAAEGHVQEPHIHIKFISRVGENLSADGDRVQLPQLAVPHRIDHSSNFLRLGRNFSCW